MAFRSASWRAVALGVVVLLLAVAPAPAWGQEAPAGVDAPAIVPKPNSGTAPTEAGDRGGALQLAVLGLVVIGVGGAVVHLTRVSRRAKGTERQP